MEEKSQGVIAAVAEGTETFVRVAEERSRALPRRSTNDGRVHRGARYHDRRDPAEIDMSGRACSARSASG